MRNRKRRTKKRPNRRPQMLSDLVVMLSSSLMPLILVSVLFINITITNLIQPTNALMMMKSDCLTSTPNCGCSWKNGKFVADCSSLSLFQVPKVSASFLCSFDLYHLLISLININY